MPNSTLIELISIWCIMIMKKIKSTIVNYGIDSFAFVSTLNSHRLDALGKVTEGFSQSRHFSLAPAGIKPLTGTAVD